jgi:hypothetical protein
MDELIAMEIILCSPGKRTMSTGSDAFLALSMPWLKDETLTASSGHCGLIGVAFDVCTQIRALLEQSTISLEKRMVMKAMKKW